MIVIKYLVLLWGFFVVVFIIIFWLSLFCYLVIFVFGVDVIRVLLFGYTLTLLEVLV